MTKAQPYLEGWGYVPLASVSDLAALKRRLTVKPKAYKPPGVANWVPPAPIEVFNENVPGYIGLPIDYFLHHHLPTGSKFKDYTSQGSPITVAKRPDPNHPNAPEGQAQFMDDLERALEVEDTVLAISGTGTGKTVTFLEVAARRGRTTLIIVHLKVLYNQWIAECKDKLGLTDSEIGRVQGKRCDYKGRKVVVAMAKTLATRRFEDDFYSYFGLVGVDEVHRMGAPLLSKCLGLFSAEKHVALTATDKRKDGCERVYQLYFGPERVRSEQQPMPMRLVPIRYTAKYPPWSNSRPSLLKYIQSDKRRNRMLAYYTAEAYHAGGHFLGVSEAIDHLDEIMELVKAEGVPASDIGYFTNQHNDERGKRIPTTEEYLEWVKRVPRVIAATYGMVQEGTDIPRLNYGMDYTPRGTGIQLWGRIRRTQEDKLPGAWYTPVDVMVPSFMNAYKARLKDAKSDPTITIGKLAA